MDLVTFWAIFPKTHLVTLFQSLFDDRRHFLRSLSDGFVCLYKKLTFWSQPGFFKQQFPAEKIKWTRPVKNPFVYKTRGGGQKTQFWRKNSISTSDY
jgi:hypothetical protein